jgi:hypothetical protein
MGRRFSKSLGATSSAEAASTGSISTPSKSSERGPITQQGEHSDIAFMAALGAAPGPFDIVSDNRSYVSDNIRPTFVPWSGDDLQAGSGYAVEDTATTHSPGFGGGKCGSLGHQRSS